MKEQGDAFSLSLGANSPPTMERTIVCTPSELVAVLEACLSGGMYNDSYGYMFPTGVKIRGTGRFMSSHEGKTAEEIIQAFPQFGSEDDFSQGGYNVTVSLSSNPASALNSEATRGASWSDLTHEPPGGGVMTATRSHSVETVQLQPINLAGIPNAPDLRLNKVIGNILYTFRWTKIPSIDWTKLDENINYLDEKPFTVPVYRKVVQPFSIYLESVEDSLDVSFQNGRFTVQPSLTLVLRERLGYTWEEYFFINADDQVETHTLTGIIPRGAKLAEIFGVS